MNVDDATRHAVERLNDAINNHDLDALMAVFSEDCVFENTFPAPDGERYEGATAVRGFWKRFFDGAPRARFVAEEAFAAGDRCVVRWTYHWDEAGGHVRGVDVFRVHGGKVAEKLAYVKG